MDLLPSILRTFVPIIVGYILSIALFAGLDSTVLSNLIGALITGAYYVVIRLLEKVNTKWGWLLGWAASPKYAPPAVEAAIQKNDNLELKVKAVAVIEG